jgi:NO-binding membrane sensor protein with MHYT domain
MLNMDTLPTGDVVVVSYLPGFIVLSYVISVMGCITTLELLHRRTSTAGFYNWYAVPTVATSDGLQL